MFARKFGSSNFSFNATCAEPSRNNYSVQCCQLLFCQQTLNIFGLNPHHLNIGSVMETCMLQTFDYRQVGVVKFYILSD